MHQISPSFLKAKNLKSFLYMIEEYNKSNKAKSKIEYIHVDVMDNEFVPNIGVDINSIKKIKERNFFADVHLMVEEPKDYINKAVELGANIITLHIEIPELTTNLRYLKEKLFNAKQKTLVGLSIKPDTDIEEILPYIYDIDLLLIMSVEPGLGGQEYLKDIDKKIKEAKKIITNKLGENDFIIEVDGGIDNKTAKLAIKNGANMLVVGSYITSIEEQGDIVTTINKLY